MKNPFKKGKTPNPQIPRSQDDIKKVYFELRARAGEAQYHVSILQKELLQLNTSMESLNNEMAARQKLDEASKKEAAEKEAKNVKA